MIWKRTLAALLALAVFPAFSGAQDLQFYREDILFRIDGVQAETYATYYFCNVGADNLKVRLFYPFPAGEAGLIDSINVTNDLDKSTVAFQKAESGINFEIEAKAYGHSAYRVYYRQKLAGNSFRYILTTTYSWGRPFESVSYQLETPAGLAIDSLSYLPDSTYTEDSIRYYSWKKNDFMPDRDFVVVFGEE